MRNAIRLPTPMNVPPENVAGNLISVFVVSAFSHDASTCLSQDEQVRAGRFKQEQDARRWASYRAALRHILGAILGLAPAKVEFILNPSGKPELPPPFDALHFNLSHCEDLAVIALSDKGPVGIDVESNNRAVDLLECESTFCHPSEVTLLPLDRNERAIALLDLWTAKEAFLKAIGTGLSSPPEDIQIHYEGDSLIAVPRDRASQPVVRLRHPGLKHHSVHLCALRPIDSIEILTGLP